MLSRGQIAGRRLLWLLSRPAPPPRAFCAAEDAQVRLLPAEVRASSEALWRKLKAGGVSVTPDFLSEEEEALLAQELEPQLRRHRYQDEHWDGAIHRYRETETSYWSKECHEILQRVRNAAFPPGGPQLTQVHVLDLDKTGYIKPHVDSVKFCGCTIAGLSLLSSSVMRLVSEQNPQDWLDLLLERRSLYILRGPARYEFTHEILKDEESSFDGRKVPRERRISVICRNLPFPGEPS
ncbi:alpha-ketoglutarate-dependent dioxygenase alkB homolog 7, mitochondrial-like [Candoia aspera]|uniref:alpha-ketoglutarate-dependent dioxygenase alkB homolog 7, mitochondrial-like n=1 Tax=Candoia aspera TaxID=51853 RepID=UPI002FD83352